MENPIVVPFDLNTARKIKSGEIEVLYMLTQKVALLVTPLWN